MSYRNLVPLVLAVHFAEATKSFPTASGIPIFQDQNMFSIYTSLDVKNYGYGQSQVLRSLS